MGESAAMVLRASLMADFVLKPAHRESGVCVERWLNARLPRLWSVLEQTRDRHGSWGSKSQGPSIPASIHYK